MGHVKWNGLQHHDTIFPLFLFLAGVSFPFSLAKQRENGATSKGIYAKIFRRAAMLIFLGMVYNGLLQFDFEKLRVASVLARIGIAWMGAALLYVNFGVKTRAWIAVAILVIYALLSKFVCAPDMPGSDPLSMEGSLVGWVDRLLMPGRLIYDNGRFDPEGLLSAVPAVVTAMLGMFTGELIRSDKFTGERKTVMMVIGGVVLAVVAWAGNFFVPINKMLWSSTFVCAVGAYSLIMMALFYYIVDVKGWQKWTLVFRVVGMNSITIYLAQRIISFSGINKFFFGGLAGLFSEQVGEVILDAGFVFVCWMFLYFLYRQKIFLKI
jgi:predicted acyltransferase